MTKAKPKKPGEIPGKVKTTLYFSDWVLEKVKECFPSKRWSENIEDSLIENQGWKEPRNKK